MGTVHQMHDEIIIIIVHMYEALPPARLAFIYISFITFIIILYISYYDYSLFTFGETEAAVK